jgi:hypothetical protein
MEKSESIINISKALLNFDSEIGKISKTETNPFFKNKYASLPDILDAIKEPLQKAGLILKQFPEKENELTTIIIHAETGEYISSTYSMKAVKDDPQQHGSRLTYQRRYAIGAVLGLNIDVDDDGNKTSVAVKTENPKETAKAKIPLPEKAFNQAIEKINKGEKNVIENMEKYYIISDAHLKHLKELVNK